MMDDEGYSQDAVVKLKNYIANGIVPNIHLITTFEMEGNPLCEEMVDMLVRYYFL